MTRIASHAFTAVVLGCSLGGSRDEAVERALDARMEFSGKPQASVLGRRERVDILLARTRIMHVATLFAAILRYTFSYRIRDRGTSPCNSSP